MTHRLTTDYAKNYCNRALILKVIVENVVTCFLLGHSVDRPAAAQPKWIGAGVLVHDCDGRRMTCQKQNPQSPGKFFRRRDRYVPTSLHH